MTTINLRELYPWYTEDAFIEVSDEVAAFLEEDKRLQINYAQYIRDNRAFYSLDAGDGIEADALNLPEQPDEALERMELERLLKEALAQLTPSQRRRLFASVLNDESNQRIAALESSAQKHSAWIGGTQKNSEEILSYPVRKSPFFLEVYERDILLSRLCSLKTA